MGGKVWSGKMAQSVKLSSVPGTQVKIPEAALVSNSSAEDIEMSEDLGLLASLG